MGDPSLWIVIGLFVTAGGLTTWLVLRAGRRR